MSRHNALTDLQRLVRAYGLLAGTCDRERAIVGTISRRWIASEVEQPVRISSLPAEFFRTPNGKDLLAAELYAGQDRDPDSLDPDSLDLPGLLQDRTVNSNRIPKLEPRVNCAVLVATMLLGVRLYGRRGNGVPEITHDLIVAAMLQDALEKPYVFSSLSSSEHELVDSEYIKTWFGSNVATLAYAIRNASQLLATDQPLPSTGVEIDNALAAVFIARLRLTARAVGDAVISYLDTERLDELRQKGISVDGAFPERDILQQELTWAQTAMRRPAVDHYSLREPVRATLLLAVQDVLDDPGKRYRLSGRRGKAVRELHTNLPLMENYVASEAPNTLETIHLASLEMMRYLEKGRRKSLSTMIAHAFRIAAFAERVLGDALEPLVVTVAMLHDVVEDGSARVTGYDQSLQKIMFRFGAPIAAMVSELTDSTIKTAGAHKARTTFEQPHLLSPEDQYNVNRFTELTLRPSDDRQPYTLSGIVIKLLDTVVSLEEGIRDPELMTNWWRHSGARIYWAEAQRGSIVYPLIERLVIELKHSETDPAYAQRQHSVNQRRLKAGMALLETTLNYLDMYATQNLAILADEYHLDLSQREFLLRSFFDANITEGRFCSLVLARLLDDSRLTHAIATGRVPSKCYVVVYPRSATADSEAELSTLLAYRRNALRRQEIRRELAVDTPEKLQAQALRQQQILSIYDQKMAGTELKSTSQDCTVNNSTSSNSS